MTGQFTFYANSGNLSNARRTVEPDNNEPKTATVTHVVTLNSSQTVRVRFRKVSGPNSVYVGNRTFTAIKM